MDKQDDGNSYITFSLIPSEELLSYFRSLGRDIELLMPEWLAQHFDKYKS
jgi:hypothetical protein